MTSWHRLHTRFYQNLYRKTQKLCLRIILDDSESSYETLLNKSLKETMEAKTLLVLAFDVF